MSNTTPVIRCPRCDHSINMHRRNPADRATTCCACQMDPNLIAVAAVQTALYGELTQPPTTVRVSRQPDGTWS